MQSLEEGDSIRYYKRVVDLSRSQITPSSENG